MSQIETIMLIVLGFAIAGLLALVLGKLLWAPVVSLGKRRSRRDDPVTIAALQADKDKLRAEYAMLSRKLELRLNDLKTRLAEQSAEVSRNRNRVDHLAGEINKRDVEIEKREDEISRLKAQIEPLEQELVTRTHSSQKLKEQIRERDEKLQLNATLIEGLQEQLQSALQSGSILDQIDTSAKDRLENRIKELTDLSRQIEDQRLNLNRQHSELKSLTGVMIDTKTLPADDAKTGTNANRDAYVNSLDETTAKLEQQLKQAEKETDDLQAELRKLDDDWSEKLTALDKIDRESKSAPKTKRRKKKKTNSEKTAINKIDVIKKPDPRAEKTIPPVDEKTNVVSLANRIRSLQADIKDQKS